MQIGVVFPQTEIGTDVGAIRAYAQAVQDMGYRHLLSYEHVLGADAEHYKPWTGPYTMHTTFHEPFVLYGFIAAVAPQLELVTGVVILPQRQTVLVAKQAAEVDVLTGGRFRLGVGIGWNHVEYVGLGEDFTNRGARLAEQIEVLRALFTRPSVTFEGKWHKIEAAGINPLPVQRPIPIWIGGSAEPALRRAALLADGFFPQKPLQGGWKATIEKMHGWMRKAGRDPSKFGMEARVNAAVGTPDDWRRELDEWRALGATHIDINTMGGGFSTSDGHVKRLREVMDVVASAIPT